MYVLNRDKEYCVYMYTSPSGKHYVGRSCNPKDVRAGKDGSGYRFCSAFWNAIQKYGWENFEYCVLEDGIRYDEIDVRENYWIEYYHSSTDENGYNLLMPFDEKKTYTDMTRQKLSESHVGQVVWNKGKTGVYSEEALKKMSDAHKGKNCGEDNPRYGKPLPEEIKEKLRQYRGEKASMWGRHHSEETRRKISERVKGHPGLKGELNPMYGKHLPDEVKQKISKKMKGRFSGEKDPMYGVHLSPTEEMRKKLSDTSSLSVMQFDMDGNYIATYKSRKEAAEVVGGDAGLVSACCVGKKKSHRGFQWCNVGDEGNITRYATKEMIAKPIAQIKDGVVVQVFPGVNAANRALGKQGSNISRCLHGELLSAYGCKWEYLSDVESPDIVR